ncbi:hypothetical protein Tco_0222897 [Tanacetum coccineum]
MTTSKLPSLIGIRSISKDTVMSDSEDSTVTYTEGVLQAPPSPDYVPDPEEPEHAPPLPGFIPELVYPEFMPLEDAVLPSEEQPLPTALSPTADSPGYVPESDLEEDPEEDDDEDPEEDPANYPADGGDNGDDEDESSDDDEDDDETEPFETDESAATPPPHHVARILAIRIPPPSPLSLWSSSLPQIPSPPLPLAPPPLPVSPTYPLGYRATMIQMRADAPSTSLSPPPHIILSHTRADTPPSGTSPSGTPPLLPIPLSTLSPPLHLPSTDHRTDRPEVCLPPRKRLCIALGPRYEVEESSSAAAARLTGGFRQTWFCCHYGQKMAPKRATRLNIALETTNTTSVTKALLPLWQHVMLTEIQMAMIAIFGNGRRMFPEEFNKIEKYVGGFPDMIHGSVVVSKPKTMQEAVEIVTELMDKKIRTFAERQTESQRKQDDNQQQKQQQNKRQNTGKAYTTGAGEKKQYGGLNPYA